MAQKNIVGDINVSGLIKGGLEAITTAPTEANTNGIKIVVLSSEPATKYDGYLYIITGSAS